MNLIQQSAGCSDFDVVFSGDDSPAFRVLLPEKITADGIGPLTAVHMIPGEWRHGDSGSNGTFAVAHALHVSVGLQKGEREVNIDLGVRNLLDHALSNMWVQICANINHLPGEPGWCNRLFIPDAPLDRLTQGRVWFEQVTPHGLFALTAEGWVGMHPSPDSPDADRVDLYSFVRSERPDAFACAARSPDGKRLFFQAWSSPCYYATPCPGNACMHLHPLIAKTLPPGAEGRARGLVGIHEGSCDALAEKLERFMGASA